MGTNQSRQKKKEYFVLTLTGYLSNDLVHGIAFLTPLVLK
jgi:hypothetical protein